MKLQMKISKILCISILVIAVLSFVFALGLSNTLYNVYMQQANGLRKNEGPHLFLEIQPFNSELVNISIISIVAALFLFVTKVHSRRKYYISNVVATIAVAGLNIGLGIYGIVNCLIFRNRFLTEVNFESYKKAVELLGIGKYSESTFWFDINAIILVISIILSLGLIANLILKFSLMKKENELLNGGTVNE